VRIGVYERHAMMPVQYAVELDIVGGRKGQRLHQTAIAAINDYDACIEKCGPQ